jgi:lipopolysaccharide/colanic/teichoic acid biosynthesis glycosyltransferase
MILKWIFDRVVALIGLLFLWPVLLIVAILIKIKMPGGPAFFVQKRVGKDGKLFNCYKFRTMIPVNNNEGAEAKKGDRVWSTVSVAGDSRITPFGTKLRHYKLDELPGLWNVLIGDMSFVGPRPDVPGYADELTGDDREVLRLRPGITGPATLKYRLEDEYLANARELVTKLLNDNDYKGSLRSKLSENLLENLKKIDLEKMSNQEVAVWYNDNVIYPDKVRINRYYLHHYSFVKDIQMIVCTVLGRKMEYAGEEI